MFTRRRFKQESSLQERLAFWANDMREKALGLQPGLERDELLKKARQAEVASHMDEWMNSHGLQPPN